MKEVVDEVRAIATRVAGSYGLAIFDVQFRRESGGMVLRIQIDRPGTARPEDGVSVEDCAAVSRDLSAVLDVEDVVPTAYILEVSSPGLDRPLRGEADYRRFEGRLAKVVTLEPVDGQSSFAGRISGIDTGALLLAEGRRMHRVPLALIKRARLDVEF